MELCAVGQLTINYKIISSHQKYVIDEDMLGLIQYYTVQGSYFINQYLRNNFKYIYHNTFLDNILDRGLRARYQDNTDVFLNDLKTSLTKNDKNLNNKIFKTKFKYYYA